MNILPHLHIKVKLSVSVQDQQCWKYVAIPCLPQTLLRLEAEDYTHCWRASYFSWLTLVLPAQLRLVPWKCHPLFSHLGASSSVAASCCVSASPSPLVVDDPVYLGCVYTVWKCFAPNNQWCGLRNIFTRYC